MLDSNLVPIVLKDYLLGDIIKFDYKLKQWKHTMGVNQNNNMANSTPIIPPSSSMYVPSSTPSLVIARPSTSISISTMYNQDIRLNDILNESSTGIMLIQFFKDNNIFTELTRVTLTETLASYFVRSNINLTPKLLDEISNQIVLTFPGELKVNILFNILI